MRKKIGGTIRVISSSALFFEKLAVDMGSTCLRDHMMTILQAVTTESRRHGRDKRNGAPAYPRSSIDIVFGLWYAKFQALTATRDWGRLDTFEKSNRSPIGYELFVRHLLEKIPRPKEAASFVLRCGASK